MPDSQRRSPEHHQGAGDGQRHGFADTDGVGFDQVALQQLDLVFGNAFFGEGAEAGVDAVVGFVASSHDVDEGAGFFEPEPHGFGHFQAGEARRDRDHVVERERLAVEDHAHGPALPDRPAPANGLQGLRRGVSPDLSKIEHLRDIVMCLWTQGIRPCTLMMEDLT